MKAATRFHRGDMVELPARLTKQGGKEGVVVFSSFCGDGVERCVVQRVVNGRTRHTVVPEDELHRIESATKNGRVRLVESMAS